VSQPTAVDDGEDFYR